MRWSEAIPATTGTVTGYCRTRRKELQQGGNTRLLETDHDGLERGVISQLLDRGTVPTGSIHENASIGGEYERGTQPRVEHEGVMSAQKRVAPAIWLRLPKRLQEVIRQMETHSPPAQRIAIHLRPHQQIETASGGEQRARGSSPRARGTTLQDKTTRGRLPATACWAAPATDPRCCALAGSGRWLVVVAIGGAICDEFQYKTAGVHEAFFGRAVAQKSTAGFSSEGV
jgi:hypothetical protein